MLIVFVVAFLALRIGRKYPAWFEKNFGGKKDA